MSARFVARILLGHTPSRTRFQADSVTKYLSALDHISGSLTTTRMLIEDAEPKFSIMQGYAGRGFTGVKVSHAIRWPCRYVYEAQNLPVVPLWRGWPARLTTTHEAGGAHRLHTALLQRHRLNFVILIVQAKLT